MYTSFAEVYDRLMADVDYPTWAAFYAELLRARGVESGKICECACGYYSIDYLDMHGLPALADVQLSDNCFLTNVDLSESGVRHLNLSTCGVESINLSGCKATNGGEFILSNNRLTTLDVSGCSGVYTLNCTNNQLTSLTLTGCTALAQLDCTYNHLTEIDIRTCTRLTRNMVHADSGVTIIY